MKKLLALLLLLPSAALAESSSLNLQLPSPGSSYGQDSFRAGELDCKNSVGGSTNLEFGVTGIIDNYESPFSGSSGNSSKDIGVYGRIIIPLDGPKERVNCNTLYQLELKKKRLEIMRLEAELEKLRNLQGGTQGVN
jgi:hypothetical protein